jgi:hypothetical protein
MVSKYQLLNNGRLPDSLSSDHHEPIELSNMVGHGRVEPPNTSLSVTFLSSTFGLQAWLLTCEHGN